MPRRDTRELILSTSLDLFNSLGEPNVSTNLIADQAEISPGNLYYHFKHKQDIVQALFSRFAEALVPLIETSEVSQIDAETLWFRLHMVFELKGQYRFIYRNIFDISSRMPAIGKALRALFQREEQAVIVLLRGLASNGVLEADPYQQAMLLEQIMMTFTYWIPFAEQFDPQGARNGDAQVRAIARVFLLLVPYLHAPWNDEADHLAAAYLESLANFT